MSVTSLENVAIVVEDLEGVTEFFTDLGLELLGTATVEGEWVDRVVGLEGVQTDVAMVQTPDGHGRLELMRFRSPPVQAGDNEAPPNTLGLRRVAFAVTDIDAVVARMRDRGASLIGDVVTYEDTYRICYLRGPEGLIVMLSEPQP